MNHAQEQSSLGAREIAIILLALATAIIHLVLAPAEFSRGGDAFKFGVLFVLNGAGYIATVLVGFAPIGFLAPVRSLARVLLALIAVASIVGYFVVGVFDPVGWVDKAIEAVLVLLLVTGGLSAKPSQPSQG